MSRWSLKIFGEVSQTAERRGTGQCSGRAESQIKGLEVVYFIFCFFFQLDEIGHGTINGCKVPSGVIKHGLLEHGP